ncbi:hypothetical protein PybrP1_012035 [[Pythium] brassicae (nom. inval.)]|nr:hypothetical protein PybrP1_012035 [[Pythium] brassicae (nom. inval.)]
MPPDVARATAERSKKVADRRPAAARGRYSFERLCAFQRYAETTSYLRVAAVSLASIMLPLAIILFLDAIPLQDPYSGWANNSSVWIRVFAGSFLLALGNCLQLQTLAPEARLGGWKSLGVGLVTGAGNCLASAVLARCWVFPVPFLAILTMPSWVAFFSAGFVLAVGRSRLTQSAQLKAQLSRYAIKMSIESTMLLVYAVYSVAFSTLRGWKQLALVCALPALKFVFKKIMKRVVVDLEDLVPVVVTTIDLFNAMYQSKCMQGSGSALTTVGIIAIDLVQNVYSLQQLFKRLRQVEAVVSDELLADGVLVYTLRLARSPERLDVDELAKLQVRSCATLLVSDDHEAVLKRLQLIQDEAAKRQQHGDTGGGGASGDSDNGSVSRPTPDAAAKHTVVGPSARLPPTAVVPWTSGADTSTSGGQQTHKLRSPSRTWTKLLLSGSSVQPLDTTERRVALTDKETTKALQQILELLWTCERVLLVEYVESAIPLLTGVYLTALYHLPNAKYYPGVADMDPGALRSVVASILVYALLELLSLGFVHLVLARRFQLSPLHQLAFALESEKQLVQGMLVEWVTVILQFTLTHYGVDFSFRFDWIASKSDAGT